MQLGIHSIYHELVRNCMRNAKSVMIDDQDLQILSDARINSWFDNELFPSWTPLWCSMGEVAPPFGPFFRADNGRPLEKSGVVQRGDQDALIVEGFHVDHVETVFAIPEDMLNPLKNLRQSFQSLHRTVSKHRFTDPRKLLLTVISERFDGERVAVDGDIVQGFLDLLSGKSESVQEDTNTSKNSLNSGGNRQQSLYALWYAIHTTCNERCLFMTANGSLGVGTDSTQEGDAVVILFGARWPFALREEGSHYRLVGPCYLEGVMDGDAVIKREREGVAPRAIEIR